MPDDLFGDAPPRTAGGKRKPPTAAARANAQQSIIDLERALAVASDPRTYALADYVPASEIGGPGRPGEFPLFIYALFNALTGVYRSARATAANLTHPVMWSVLRGGIATALGQEVADALPDRGPNRNQWNYNREKLLNHLPAVLAGFREQALEQAVAQGLLDPAKPRNWSAPEQSQLIVGDGTIPKSPVNARQPTSVDPKTGELRHHRVDPGAGEHTEGGEGGQKVWGPKFIILSTRNEHYHERVILDVRYQKPGHPGGEAGLAVDMLLQLATGAVGVLSALGVVWDGALRGVHRNALAKAGLLVINKQHGGMEPEPLMETVRGEHCYHDLWAVDGRVAERILTEDGTAEFRPVDIAHLERRPSSDSCRWYHLLRIPCPHGAHTHRIRLDQTDQDVKRDFNRTEHLRQIPPGTQAFARLYGHRPDSESVNSALDATWRWKRIIAYGSARQTLAMLGFAQCQNALARFAHQRRQELSHLTN